MKCENPTMYALKRFSEGYPPSGWALLTSATSIALSHRAFGLVVEATDNRAHSPNAESERRWEICCRRTDREESPARTVADAATKEDAVCAAYRLAEAIDERLRERRGRGAVRLDALLDELDGPISTTSGPAVEEV